MSEENEEEENRHDSEHQIEGSQDILDHNKRFFDGWMRVLKDEFLQMTEDPIVGYDSDSDQHDVEERKEHVEEKHKFTIMEVELNPRIKRNG